MPDSRPPSPAAPASPNIDTSRLLLRPAEPGDLAHYTRLWTDPEVRRFLGGPVAGAELALYGRYFTARPYVFSVLTRQDPVLVGMVSVEADSRFGGRREVSYSFLPEHWGRGYAREAVRAAVVWAWEAVPSREPSVVAVTQEANTRSRRLLESLGMRLADAFTEWDAPQVMYAVEPGGLR